MLHINEFGGKCIQCKGHINPYEGKVFMKTHLIFHHDCIEEPMNKLVNHFLKIMEIDE